MIYGWDVLENLSGEGRLTSLCRWSYGKWSSRIEENGNGVVVNTTQVDGTRVRDYELCGVYTVVAKGWLLFIHGITIYVVTMLSISIHATYIEHELVCTMTPSQSLQILNIIRPLNVDPQRTIPSPQPTNAL